MNRIPRSELKILQNKEIQKTEENYTDPNIDLETDRQMRKQKLDNSLKSCEGENEKPLTIKTYEKYQK